MVWFHVDKCLLVVREVQPGLILKRLGNESCRAHESDNESEWNCCIGGWILFTTLALRLESERDRRSAIAS